MSGMLKSNRTSDATYIGQTDNWNIDLEQDIASILGVPIDTSINAPIFSDGYENTGDVVRSTGKVAGVIRFLTESADYDLAAGVEFEHASIRYKIACLSEALVLFQWNNDDGVWEELLNLNEGGGATNFTDLADVDHYETHANEYVVVNENADGLTYAASAAVSMDLEDLADVPPYVNDSFLHIDGDGNPEWSTTTPGNVENFGDLDDCYTPAVGQDLDDEAYIGWNVTGVVRVGQSPESYKLIVESPVSAFFEDSSSSHSLVSGNHVTIGWNIPREWDGTSGSLFSPAVDGGECRFPADRPGVYLIELFVPVTGDGNGGGEVLISSQSAELECYAPQTLFCERIVKTIANPPYVTVTIKPRYYRIVTYAWLKPSGADVGERSGILRVEAWKYPDASAVQLGAFHMVITKVK